MENKNTKTIEDKIADIESYKKRLIFDNNPIVSFEKLLKKYMKESDQGNITSKRVKEISKIYNMEYWLFDRIRHLLITAISEGRKIALSHSNLENPEALIEKEAADFMGCELGYELKDYPEFFKEEVELLIIHSILLGYAPVPTKKF